MLVEWLEPSIISKLEQVYDKCERASNNLDNDFYSALNRLKNKLPEQLQEDILMLENVYLLKVNSVIESSYRLGLDDGYKLNNEAVKLIKEIFEFQYKNKCQ